MFFELLTDTPLEEVQTILAGHPKEAKLTLGKSIIAQYHDLAEADAAAARWENEIGQGALPEHIPAMVIPHAELEQGKLMAVKLLTLLGMCQSSGEARRMIAQGAVYLGEEKTRIDSHEEMIPVENDLLVRVGKKKICRVKLN
jgi:tyrosyl-tRNA synthetase